MAKRPKIKSVETVYHEKRNALFKGLGQVDRRTFLKLSAAAVGAAAASGVGFPPHSFLPVSVAHADTVEPFRFAYISDSHLYGRQVNERFVRQLMRAVDDINNLEPQSDFVLYGGDLAQLGQAEELDLGAEILQNVSAPLRMMVGEHDWYFDLGEKWRDLFGEPTYSFDHGGVHFVTLLSVVEEDFWTPAGLTPMERMRTVAGLDNGRQSPFQVGAEQREWLRRDLEGLSNDTPLIVFSHSPLYKLYRNWNFWTDDAEEVQALLNRFDSVVVIHGHTHQVLTNRIGNIHFHGMPATAWPWPYAPEGLPEMTIQMNRPNPFDPNDGQGDGFVQVHSDGLVDMVYELWNRNRITVTREYMLSGSGGDGPPEPNLGSY